MANDVCICAFQEGSMDSLYEPVQEHQESKDTMSIDSRSSTPLTTYVKWGPPDRSMSLVSENKL